MLAIPIEQAIVPSLVQVAIDADRERVRDVVRDVVYPADARVPRRAPRRVPRRDPRGARALVGAQRRRALPDADPCAGRRSTWTPQEIHEIGLEELEAIEVERREIARPPGSATTPRRTARALADDPANSPSSQGRAGRPGARGHRAGDGGRAALLRRAAEGRLRRACRSRSTRRRTRRSPTTTRRRPTARAPGIYYANGYDLPSAQVHEARLDDLPRGGARATTSRSRSRWRTRASTRSAASARGSSAAAYVEGWGLYSERLADEMGLFRNEGERFGMLDASAWRAARLVVDTGLHALRWARQRSIDFLLERRACPRPTRSIETDRYICWPGQALTYKIGQREIERLRRGDHGPRRRGVRPARVPRPGPRPRLAAARDAGARAAELGRDPGLTPTDRTPSRRCPLRALAYAPAGFARSPCSVGALRSTHAQSGAWIEATSRSRSPARPAFAARGLGGPRCGRPGRAPSGRC